MDHCLLKLLRESVYGDIRSFWQNECTAEDRDRICNYANGIMLAPYLYRYLHDLLPADHKNTFRQHYTTNSLRAIKYQKALNELCQLFEQNQIRFCVLKGGDFAFNYYPDPAMRYFCDLDIWIHPDDCTKMLPLLRDNGWQAPYLRVEQVDEHFHYSPHKKDGIVMEPHWSLSSFIGRNPVILWQEFLTVDTPWQYRYKMSPEVKLLSLCRHFATEEYRHMPLCKFLLDAAWILKKETVDWEKLRLLSASFQFESCNDLLGSQDEFFPQEIIDAIAPDPEMSGVFRKLFELQEQLPAIDLVEIRVRANKIFSKIWFMTIVHAFSPIVIRRKHKLPEQGQVFRLLCATIHDIIVKIPSSFSALFHRDPVKKEYNRLLKKISSQVKE